MKATLSEREGLMLGGGALALAALGLALLRWTGDAAPGPAPARAAGPEAAGGVTAPALPARRWSPGTTYVYELENRRTVAMSGDQRRPQSGTVALSGRLTISVVGPAPGGAGSLLRLALAPRGPGPAGAFHAVADADGRLGAFAFPRGMAGDDRATLKVVASALQVVVPDPSASAWSATEEDATGEYEAAYRAAGGGIHKVKERFVRARGPQGLAPIADPAAYTVASASDVALDASGWPRAVTEEETLTLKLGAMQIDARNRTTAQLVAVERAPGLERLAAAEAAGLEPEPAADAEGFATADRRADQGLVDGASYGALLADLAAGDVRVRNRTMARLAALLRVQPAVAEEAAASILGGKLDEETGKRVLGSLGGAGTAEAQQALAAILRAPGLGAEARSDAAMALGLSAHPTGDSQQALLQAAGSADPDVASSATLGLGNLARHMGEEGAGDPADAIAALVQRLAGATSEDEQLLCLAALGNSGAPAALAAIAPYLAAGSVRVRAAAVEALRFMAGVEGQIATAMHDPAPEVRRAAAGTLAHRAITPVLAAVTTALQHDPDPRTRLALVTALAFRKRDEPALVELLTWAAAHDPDADVQGAAKDAIAPPAERG